MGDALHRRPAQAGAALTHQPPQERRPLDVRVGSATDGLTPISVAQRSLGARLSQWVQLATIVAAAIGADQATKQVVASQLRLDEGVHVLGPFWIRHVENPGIAFGLFASATPIVILLTTIAVAWMLGYFARSGARHPVLPVALGLVIGGSVSNLADRVRSGYVTDFIHLSHWPTFNLADASIVTGVALLLIGLARIEPRDGPPLDQPAG